MIPIILATVYCTPVSWAPCPYSLADSLPQPCEEETSLPLCSSQAPQLISDGAQMKTHAHLASKSKLLPLCYQV